MQIFKLLARAVFFKTFVKVSHVVFSSPKTTAKKDLSKKFDMFSYSNVFLNTQRLYIYNYDKTFNQLHNSVIF